MWKNVKMTLGRRLTQTLRRRNPVVTLENLMKNVKKKKKKGYESARGVLHNAQSRKKK